MEFEKNPDGTDKLDEQGNPIPVKIKDNKDEESAKVIGNLVEELKESRLKLGIAEGLLKANAEKKKEEEPKPLTDDEKLDALLDKKFQERQAAEAINNKKIAFEKFILEHKEFHPENDPTGLKKDALQKRFNEFNVESLKTVEEFTSKIKDAKTLLMGNDNPLDISLGKIPNSEIPVPGANPAGRKVEELTPKELKLAQTTGKTKEQILKLKISNPEYLKTLLEYVPD